MIKHTPGPWRKTVILICNEPNNTAVVRSGGAGWGAAPIATLGEPSSETEANAALIAAAPDLYIQVRRLLNLVNIPSSGYRKSYPQVIADSLAALAKAEGTL